MTLLKKKQNNMTAKMTFHSSTTTQKMKNTKRVKQPMFNGKTEKCKGFEEHSRKETDQKGKKKNLKDEET